jgi:hypothetical protein
MDTTTTLQESIKDLYNFEYFAFKKTFAIVFILVGLGTTFYYIFDYFAWTLKIEIAINVEPIFYFFIPIVIFFYLSMKTASLTKTTIKNGSLVVKKNLGGWFLLVIGFLYKILADLILKADYIVSFLVAYIFIFILLFLYYQMGESFFPKVKDRSIKKIVILIGLSGILHFIFWKVLSYLYPSIQLFSTGSYDYSIFSVYNLINNLVTSVLCIIIGLFILNESTKIGRDVLE